MSSSPAMSPQLSTMQSGLLLVLTLLGMASALPPGTLEVPAGREEGSRRCFMVVKALCTYKGAQVRGMGRSAGCQCQASTCVPQSYCQDIYKGQLPSVHSTATNKQLRKLAATYTYCNLWIRGVTRCKGGSWKTSWEDLSPWNYAKWASRQPCRWFRTCTVFNPKDGLWRSRACFLLHPFLCQY
ncbi:bone marrow proteoglycan-like [Phasianus colchicus]|uniref:bone marrow proteoglycan-like n=1 Tax=Phasianus colchicus TaxID=9054 RepID=UPI00129E7BCB|nr:bone marrow proteoglycan-like [Phasianus colchicus]